MIHGEIHPRISNVLAISLIIPLLVGLKFGFTFKDVDMVSDMESHSNPNAFGCGESEQLDKVCMGSFSLNIGSIAWATTLELLLHLQRLNLPFNNKARILLYKARASVGVLAPAKRSSTYMDSCTCQLDAGHSPWPFVAEPVLRVKEMRRLRK